MLNLLITWLNKKRSAQQFPLSDYERIKHELRPGDVLLVEGRSRISDIIRWLTDSPWTHAALYIGRLYDLDDPDIRKLVQHHYQGSPEDRLIIESLLGQGTIVRSMDYYKTDHLRICRPARLAHKDAQQVVRYAVSRLGTEYDVRQIFDLARFLLPLPLLPRRWASTLFFSAPGPSTHTVCSTMIARAFGYVRFPILPLVKHVKKEEGTKEEGSNEAGAKEDIQLFRRNEKLCTPKDFDYSPYFEIIKYSFYDYPREEYQLLPWVGSIRLDANEAEEYHTGELDSETQKSVETAIADAVNRLNRATAIQDDAEYRGD